MILQKGSDQLRSGKHHFGVQRCVNLVAGEVPCGKSIHAESLAHVVSREPRGGRGEVVVAESPDVVSVGSGHCAHEVLDAALDVGGSLVVAGVHGLFKERHVGLHCLPLHVVDKPMGVGEGWVC